MMGRLQYCKVHLPEPTSLYRFISESGAVLYIGVTNNVTRRWFEHEKEKPWAWQVSHIEITTFTCRDCALDAERWAIRAENPRYNLQSNDFQYDNPHWTLCPHCKMPTKPWDEGTDAHSDLTLSAYQCARCHGSWIAEWSADGQSMMRKLAIES
jgi:predicted GIY-YIG superfamily endonuclease